MNKSFQEIRLDLDGPELTIAMAQIEGPLPNGKTLAFVEGRETYVWKSRAEIDRRTKKAETVLDHLHRKHPGTNLVIFPEYSLPITETVSILQAKANEYGFIIVAGSDNLKTEPNGKFFNQCPVLIPHQPSPVWIIKQHVSQWEFGPVGEPDETPQPIFYWEHAGQRYYLAIRICMDLLYVDKDTLPADRPTVVIVPMCSQDILTFRTQAQTLLRYGSGGRAAVLCNCIGELSAGASCVICATSGARSTEPALSLPSLTEVLAVFNLDCNSLLMSRPTTIHTKPPLGDRWKYDIDARPDDASQGYVITPAHDTETKRVRAVINPALYAAYGKSMGVTFLNIERFDELETAFLQSPKYECYAVLGQRDIAVTHLYQDIGDMDFDITRALHWSVPTTLLPSEESYGGSTRLFPWFEVTMFHKVLGIEVTEADVSSFLSDIPDTTQVSKILTLGRNSADTNITSEEWKEFLKKRWILGESNLDPGEIDAVMTIHLEHPRDVGTYIELFNRNIMPKLIENPCITSIFQGSSNRMSVHYLLRVGIAKNDLFEFIRSVYTLAHDHRVMITTQTYVILKKCSSLDLRRNLLVPEISAKYKKLRAALILPRLDFEAQDRFREHPSEKQNAIILLVDKVERSITPIRDEFWWSGRLKIFEEDLVRGLAEGNVKILASLINTLREQTEERLEREVLQLIPKEFLDAWIARNIDPKKAGKLGFGDYLKIFIQFSKDSGAISSAVHDATVNLFEVALPVRNAVAHSRWEQLSPEKCVAALVAFAEYLGLFAKQI